IDEDTSAAETLGVRMAFLDEGTGRAEADFSGGSMPANQNGLLTECWNSSLTQQYWSLSFMTDGTEDASIEDGDAGNCGMFQTSLSELGIPTLQDIDQGLYSAMSELAETGVVAE
ncbi:MAG: hypothetical protein AAGC55_16130, partial [Myxococcota bacterium]